MSFLRCQRNGKSSTFRKLNHALDVPVNGDNSPVRWMAPEILRKLDNEDDFAWSKEGNMWSLAVTLWEVMTFAERPFSELSDFRFVAFALSETDQLPSKIGKLRVLVSHLNRKGSGESMAPGLYDSRILRNSCNKEPALSPGTALHDSSTRM